MSKQNVKIVRQMWEDYSERGSDPDLEYFTEDCVMRVSAWRSGAD